MYGTYLGGDGNTFGSGITIDNNQVAYITGATSCTPSKFQLKDPVQSTLNGIRNAYVIAIDTKYKFNESLFFGTYLGGNMTDGGSSIALDSLSNIYVTGTTNSATFPIINGFQTTLPAAPDAFLTKIGMSLPTDLVLEKDSCKCTICINEKLPYTLTVINKGPNIATNIVVTDTVPYGVYVYSLKSTVGTIELSNGIILWNIPTLSVGENASAMVILIPTEKICFEQDKYIINQCSLKADNSIINPSSAISSVITLVECFCCNCKNCGSK